VLDASEIRNAKANLNLDGALHEHDDCIRIAYEWLDAQQVIRSRMSRPKQIKHLIERWAGRYVLEADVIVAATLHPKISGEYPYFNLSSRLTEPSVDRLRGIGEAFTQQNYRDMHSSVEYTRSE
jgi:hypothetical protein